MTNANEGAPEIYSDEKIKKIREKKSKKQINLLVQKNYFLKIY